jgi:2-polyprenyl-3-methyl-5-hydroxy-6-metoxy-1,4-benzoquinol methylase
MNDRSNGKSQVDIVEYNRAAWNRQSLGDCRWCQPVGSADIDAARSGKWSVILTPNKSVPPGWFGNLKGKKVLCLASGGGQQAPILAAAGADVASFDNSDEQLAKDRRLAEAESLALKTVRGDMADLSVFANESFDLIFHPVSNLFVESLKPVWTECFRVLKWNGSLLSGFTNPTFFLFDHDEVAKTGKMEVKYPLPYSDLGSLSAESLDQVTGKRAYEFGHTLEDQIGGQLAAGFVICDFYEDDWDNQATPLNEFIPLYAATLARKIQLSVQH